MITLDVLRRFLLDRRARSHGGPLQREEVARCEQTARRMLDAWRAAGCALLPDGPEEILRWWTARRFPSPAVLVEQRRPGAARPREDRAWEPLDP